MCCTRLEELNLNAPCKINNVAALNLTEMYGEKSDK